MGRQKNPGTFSTRAMCITKPDTALHGIFGTCFLGMAALAGSQAGSMVAYGMCMDRGRDKAVTRIWELLKRFF